MKQGIKLQIVFVLSIITIFFAFVLMNANLPSRITNFEECAAAGNPIMESFPRQCRDSEGNLFVEDIFQLPEEIKETFPEKLWERGAENAGGFPIEGFNPGLYQNAFPGIMDSDFSETDAVNGHWIFENEELEFVREGSGFETSADGTLTREGTLKLLENIQRRLLIQINSEKDIDDLLDDLSVPGILCTDESREAEACIALFDPVCGWFNPDKVRCVTEPCAADFSNSCFACMDETVLYYTQGECPQ